MPRTSWTDTEQRLAEIWQRVLAVDEVGRDDNFFALGGDSVNAAAVSARVQEQLGVPMSVAHVFRAPTIASLSALLEAAPAQTHDPIVASVTPEASVRPCSFAQQRMWFLSQIGQASAAAYVIPLVLRVRGALDAVALRAALQQVVDRHAALRTTFPVRDGRPVQLVQRETTVDFAEEYRLDTPAASRAAEIETIVRAEVRRPFDLATELPLRARLVRCAADDHFLILTIHHIAWDWWSRALLFEELREGYRAAVTGHATELPALPVQYADYAEWERGRATTDAAALDYWTQQLTGAPELLELPTDRARPAVQTHEGGIERVVVPPPLAQALRAASRTHDVTLFMMLLAAFQTLLSRYSGQTDISVGTPIATRTREDVHRLIGLFVNTLVMRTDLSDDPTVRELLARVREVALDAYEHEVPFERLLGAVRRPRSLSHSPLFQVMFQLRNLRQVAPQLDGLEVSLESMDHGTAPFDISVDVVEAGDTLSCSMNYNTALFDRDTVRRMLTHFVTLLHAFVEQPETRVSHLPMTADDATAEATPSGPGWSQRASPASVPTRLPVDGHRTLADLFDAQATRTPDAVALRCQGASLTYAQVQKRVDAVAQQLRDLGAGPNVLVGLCMERSLELVVGLLAILKAGGAYLPIDLAYPADRLAFMLADAKAPLLLTHSSMVSQLPNTTSRVVCIDEIAIDAPRADTIPTATATTPDDLAYVIYTSGTTGQPKGAELTHRNVVRLFSSTEHWFGFNEQDVWTLFHSTAFDFSVWELFGALLYGGRLVIVPHVESRSPEQFHALLRSEAVTVLNQTPSAFRQLSAADAAAEPGTLALRYVVFGGEALNLASLRPWFERHGDVRPQLVNMYGITETTVHVTYRPLSMDDVQSGSVIGVPIPDLDVHILDAARRPVPIGVPGEMFVGGAGLARGYLRRPDLTAARFVDDHLSGRAGARLYKTGDLARRLANGDIEYLGRADDQVKIRGFRIELGEIESVLHAHPDIAEACVIVREDSADEKRLVAYLVGRGAVNLPSVRALLRTKLPEYMVPAAFVTMDALPLTASGKIDRRKLPAPDMQRPDLDVAFAVPTSALERQIADVWQGVLRVSSVGVHDNFFDLGGDSILALQLIGRLRQAGWVVTLTDVFERGSIAELAAVATPIAEPGSAEQSEPRDNAPSTPREYTPSDFPDAPMDQAALADLIRQIS